MSKRQHGFTLIEVLIAVAISAILAAIAVPSYRSYVQDARREQAKAALVELAQQLEAYYSVNQSYLGAADSSGKPTQFATQVPTDGGEAYYTLTITGLTQTGYTLNAIPVSGGSQANDSCGTLTLARNGYTTPTSGCW